MSTTSKTSRIKTLATATLHEVPKVKKDIKARLPTLNANDIRRYKEPYRDVVLLELREEGRHEAAEYLQFLFELDEESRTAAGPDSVIWNKTWLKNNHSLIDELRRVMSLVFDYDTSSETKTGAMICLALTIENSDWNWWWIAEALYRSAFSVVEDIKDDDRETFNALRYLYAKFLFFKLRKAKRALEYVRRARRESRDKVWRVPGTLDSDNDDLFRECCALMFAVLVHIAREAREEDPEMAVDSCKVALSSAVDSGRKKLIAEAHLELGESEAAARNFCQAIEHLNESLVMLMEFKNAEGICRVHSKLAYVYQEIGEEDKVLEQLKKFKDTAAKYNLTYKLAEAHYATAEYYLSQDNPQEAVPNFETAYSLFNRIGARNEAGHTRCLLGISKGQQLVGKYQALIKQSVEGVPDALLKIILWKDRGEAFD